MLPYEEVKTWTIPALKEFCRRRNLKVSGTKEHLVARVFAAAEMGIEELPTAEERVTTTKREKAKLLVLPNGNSLPDPFTLKEGWVKERCSMTSWPPIYLSDITLFLMADHPGNYVNFHKRTLNEYKEGKAFRLYDSGWLKEISFHAISDDSEYCFLQAQCTHSMKISHTPHSAWICTSKTTGNILSAYCTCVAG